MGLPISSRGLKSTTQAPRLLLRTFASQTLGTSIQFQLNRGFAFYCAATSCAARRQVIGSRSEVGSGYHRAGLQEEVSGRSSNPAALGGVKNLSPDSRVCKITRSSFQRLQRHFSTFCKLCRNSRQKLQHPVDNSFSDCKMVSRSYFSLPHRIFWPS